HSTALALGSSRDDAPGRGDHSRTAGGRAGDSDDNDHDDDDALAPDRDHDLEHDHDDEGTESDADSGLEPDADSSVRASSDGTSCLREASELVVDEEPATGTFACRGTVAASLI